MSSSSWHHLSQIRLSAATARQVGAMEMSPIYIYIYISLSLSLSLSLLPDVKMIHYFLRRKPYFNFEIKKNRPNDLRNILIQPDTYIHTYIHTPMRACVHACMHACIHAYMHTYMHTCIHAYMHAYMHTCIHPYIHTCMHAYMHTCIHAYMHTCIHACMHTCIHTYIHTYIHIIIRIHMNTYDVLWVGYVGNSWDRTTLIPLSPTKTQKSASVENMAEIHPRPAEGFNEKSSFNHQSLWLKILANLWYLDGTHCLERFSHLHGATNGPWRWSRAAVVAVFLLSASAQRSLVAHSRGSGCVIDSTPSEVFVCVCVAL